MEAKPDRLEKLEEKIDKIYVKLFEGNGKPPLMERVSLIEQSEHACRAELKKSIDDLTLDTNEKFTAIKSDTQIHKYILLFGLGVILIALIAIGVITPDEAKSIAKAGIIGG